MLASSLGWDEKQIDQRLHPPVQMQMASTKPTDLPLVKNAPQPQNNQVKIAQKVSIQERLHGDSWLSNTWGIGATLFALLFLVFWLMPVPPIRLSLGGTAVPATAVLATAVPATAVPATAVPTTAVPTTAVPTTAVPTTAVPTTAVPTTALPTIAGTPASTPTVAQKLTMSNIQNVKNYNVYLLKVPGSDTSESNRINVLGENKGVMVHDDDSVQILKKIYVDNNVLWLLVQVTQNNVIYQGYIMNYYVALTDPDVELLPNSFSGSPMAPVTLTPTPTK
jgi:hypothetical protein